MDPQLAAQASNAINALGISFVLGLGAYVVLWTLAFRR